MSKHKVTFQPGGVTVGVDPATHSCGKHGRPGSLLDIALANGLRIEHSCGGVAVCGTCHVIVTSGMDHLSQASDDEMDVVAGIPGSTLNSRLACQAIVEGDVTVTIPKWSRHASPEKA